MKRPAEISATAWDAAREATGGWMAAGEPEVNEALVKSVARAIMTAASVEPTPTERLSRAITNLRTEHGDRLAAADAQEFCAALLAAMRSGVANV